MLNICKLFTLICGLTFLSSCQFQKATTPLESENLSVHKIIELANRALISYGEDLASYTIIYDTNNQNWRQQMPIPLCEEAKIGFEEEYGYLRGLDFQVILYRHLNYGKKLVQSWKILLDKKTGEIVGVFEHNRIYPLYKPSKYHKPIIKELDEYRNSGLILGNLEK
ncbi:MAG: hypothetical protein JEZ07_18775 [Phycisphaerae bacterium]|nr:hypothetical protein [Phycisphaerae bacterium]